MVFPRILIISQRLSNYKNTNIRNIDIYSDFFVRISLVNNCDSLKMKFLFFLIICVLDVISGLFSTDYSLADKHFKNFKDKNVTYYVARYLVIFFKF